MIRLGSDAGPFEEQSHLLLTCCLLPLPTRNHDQQQQPQQHQNQSFRPHEAQSDEPSLGGGEGIGEAAAWP